jgi:membrane associated rhomboid family serine protease
MDPISTYVIAVIVAIILGSYVLTGWKRIAFTTVTIFACVIIYLVYMVPDLVSKTNVYSDVVGHLGFWNITVTEGFRPWGIFTHLYIHGDNFMHVLFNMLVLYIMGMPFEDRVGKFWMAVVYLVTGMVGGALLTGVLSVGQGLSIGIGASAAISGVLGAFAVMYPDDRIPMILVVILVDRVRVITGALVFLLFQSLMLLIVVQFPSVDEAINIGFLAHIMGFIVGAVMGFGMKRMDIKPPDSTTTAQRRLETLDLEVLRPLAYSPSLAEKLDATVAEDIAEVREVLVEDLVSRLRCPDCASILTRKGHTVRCEGCEYRLDLRKGRSG